MNTQNAAKPGGLCEQMSKGRRAQILAVVAIGTFMGPLDSSVVNIALPSIKNTFQTTLPVVEWVVMAYLLIISSLLLTFGRMGDMYGHKKIYIAGFATFTVGSLLCGMAPTISALIAFRVVQAVGAGMLMSMGPAIITDITPPQERGKSMGVIAVAVSVALTTGPVLGGFLTAKFGWPSIFLINIPVGILVIFLSQLVIPNTKGHDAQPFDIRGAVTFFIALISILLPLTYTERVGWTNPYLLGWLAFGLALMIFFVILEKRTKHPMVDMSLFKNRLFSMANLSALLNYIALFSTVIMMPFYLQQLRGLSPSEAGVLLIPMPLTTMLVAPISGAVSDRIDSRYLSSIGMAIVSLGLWILSNLQIDSPRINIIIALIVLGLGSGLFQTPNNSAIMGSVPPNRRGIASGLLASMRNIGMVFGVAISGAVFTGRLNYLTEYLSGQGLAGNQLKVEAFTGAMHLAYIVSTLIAAAAVVTSLIRGQVKTAEKIQ